MTEDEQILLSLGFDPASHEIDPITGEVFQLIPSSPAPANIQPAARNIQKPKTRPSVFGAIKGGLKNVAGEAIGGGGAMLAAAPFAAALGPAAPLGLLAAGIGGSFLGGKTQDKLNILPTSEQEQTSIEAHPNISFASEFLPDLLLAGPSRATFKLAGSGAKKLLGKEALSTLEKAALKDTAVGAVIPTAIEGGGQLVEGEFSPSRLAIASIAGGTFNTPTALGRRIYKDGVTDINESEANRLSREQREVTKEAVERVRQEAIARKQKEDMFPVNDDGQREVKTVLDEAKAEVDKLTNFKEEANRLHPPPPAQKDINDGLFAPKEIEKSKEVEKPVYPANNKGQRYSRDILREAKKETERLTKFENESPMKQAQSVKQKAINEGLFSKTALKNSKLAQDILAQERLKKEAKIAAQNEKKGYELLEETDMEVKGLNLLDDKTRRKRNQSGAVNTSIITDAASATGRVMHRLILSEVDKIRKLPSKYASLAADATTLYYNKLPYYKGRASGMLDAFKGLNKSEMEMVYHTLLNEDRSNTILRHTLPDKLQKNYDEFRNTYSQIQQERINAGQPLSNGKQAHITPTAMFHRTNPNAIKTINAGGIPAAKLRDDFINYHKAYGFTTKNAIDKLEKIVKHGASNDLTEFGAVRKEGGIGLPDSWLEMDVDKAIRGYISRWARDRAYYDAIEYDPDLEYLLKTDPSILKKKKFQGRFLDDFGKPATLGNESGPVQTVMRDILQGRESGTIKALQNLYNSMAMGHLTAIAEMATPLKYMTFLPPSQWLMMSKNMLNIHKHITQTYKQARKAGVIMDSIRTMHNLEESSNKYTEIINTLADKVNTISGRGFGEKVSRTLSYANADFVRSIQSDLANNGNVKAQEFLNKFVFESGKTWEDLNPDEINARITRVFQGAYDLTELPEWVEDSPLSPFLRLARWSIGQANNYKKFVIDPARNGDFAPLIKSTLIAGASGFVIDILRHKAGAGEIDIPGFRESIAAAEGTDQMQGIMYKTLYLQSLAGNAGIMSDIARMVVDSIYDNTPQGFKYPMVTTTGNAATSLLNTMQALSEANTVDDYASVTINSISEFLRANTQAYRATRTALARLKMLGDELEDEQDDKKMQRSLRVFNQLHDISNPHAFMRFTDPEKFKKSNALEESRTPQNTLDVVKQGGAKEQLAEILSQARNPQDLMSLVQSFGRKNSPQVMPGKTDTIDRLNYIAWRRASGQDPTAPIKEEAEQDINRQLKRKAIGADLF